MNGRRTTRSRSRNWQHHARRRFSTHAFDREFFDKANSARRHDLHYLEARLTPSTTALAHGLPAVCAFVNDQLDASVLTALASGGTRMIALRSAGFNHVDVKKARELGFTVSRVAGLLATCGGGAHDCPDPVAEPQDSSCVRQSARR